MTPLQTQDFHYDLPKDRIAFEPAERRDGARLMVLSRQAKTMEHTYFSEIARYLRTPDTLVLNDTRVIKARLKGEKRGTGGRVDLLLLHESSRGVWEALVSPSRRIHPGTEIRIAGNQVCRIAERLPDGKRLVAFETDDVMALLEVAGEVPLPPYIKREPLPFDRERYQTVYASKNGSVAAPTAGLHFTEPLLEALRAGGVAVASLTLHVGLGTFRPVKEADPAMHILEPEHFEVDAECAAKVNAARRGGGRVVAVGTTSVRSLETAADLSSGGDLAAASGWTDKLILPPYEFKCVDALLTNFHLPCSTLLMLVCAFAGKDFILEAYREAVSRGYRFYSYGDAMLVT
jgi:S-adenosylmethionine:tRNA ribosyltransferase-isomerase